MSTPLARGSISLRLYPHDLPPAALVEEIAAQAALAERVGFDGVMLSEHHGGFPNYLPNPLLAATWALAATEQAWAAACPMLLPLRPSSQIVEDIAWTAQRFPGRVGAGFASGAAPVDFELAGVPFEEMGERFRAALPYVVEALSGRAEPPLMGDPAVAALAVEPVPVVSAAQSPAAARRAGNLGIGILFDSLISTDRAAEVSEVHAATGSAGPRILIRRAWVGDAPGTAVAAQMDRFRRIAREDVQTRWASDGGLVSSTDATEVADRLTEVLAATGCDALNLRVFHAGISPAQAREQIERLGGEVLARLRKVLPGPDGGSTRGEP